MINLNSKEIEDISNAFNKAMKYVEGEQEKYWNSLSKDEQLKVFCAVCRRIYKGEILDQRSYRGVLYDVFGFGPEAYGQAQVAGYLTIHNAIFTSEQEQQMLTSVEQMLQNFAKWLKIENPEEKVSEYYRETY